MFNPYLFNLISYLISSRWARGYEEHHGACEDTCTAHIGPLHLEVNHCFVLDHTDAFLAVQFPTFRGRLHLGYVICLGEDEIRQPGWYAYWQKSLLRLCSAQVPKVVCGQASQPESYDDFPF